MLATSRADCPLIFLPAELRRVVAEAAQDLADDARVWLVGCPPESWRPDSEHRPLADLGPLADPEAPWTVIAEAIESLGRGGRRPVPGADPLAVIGIGSASDATAIWERPLAGVGTPCLSLLEAIVRSAGALPRARHHFEDLGELAWWLEDHSDGFEADEPVLQRGEERPERPWGEWRDHYLRVGRGPQHDGEIAPDRRMHGKGDDDAGLWLLGADMTAFDLVRDDLGDAPLELRVARILVNLNPMGHLTGQVAYLFTGSSDVMGFDKQGRTLHGDPKPVRFIGAWIMDEALALVNAHQAREESKRRLPEPARESESGSG